MDASSSHRAKTTTPNRKLPQGGSSTAPPKSERIDQHYLTRLRDEIAMAVLPLFVANDMAKGANFFPQCNAHSAYAVADAMLAYRAESEVRP